MLNYLPVLILCFSPGIQLKRPESQLQGRGVGLKPEITVLNIDKKRIFLYTLCFMAMFPGPFKVIIGCIGI